MNDHSRRYFDRRSLDARRQRLPLVAQLMSGLLAALVVVLLVLAITSAAWAILYLIHTAP